MLPSCYEVTSTTRSYEKVRKGQPGKRAKDMLIKHNPKDRDSKLTFKADTQVSLAVRILCHILWLVGLRIIVSSYTRPRYNPCFETFCSCLLALLYSYPDLPASIFLQPLESISKEFAPATCPHSSNLCPNLCPNLSSERIVMPAACLPAESGATAFTNLTRAPVPWLSFTMV